jgi:hypothetical protein
MKRRVPEGLELVSTIALVGASLLLAVALGGALRVAPAPGVAPASPMLTLASARPASQSPADSTAVELASDPFSPDRALPAEAVQPEESAPVDSTPANPVGAVRLLGTVVRGAGGFALCQLPADVPRVVHVGERLGELTLISLEQGRAVFRAPNGTRLELSLSTPGT